jgi:hypothetical protein
MFFLIAKCRKFGQSGHPGRQNHFFPAEIFSVSSKSVLRGKMFRVLCFLYAFLSSSILGSCPTVHPSEYKYVHRYNLSHSANKIEQ